MPACYYDPGDYTCVKDSVAMYWDPNGSIPGYSGKGCWRAPLGGVRATPLACEQPKHDNPGERLDQAVRSETDQRDRARGKSGGERDCELDHVPADTAPGKQPRSPLEPRSLRRRRTDRQDRKSQRPRLAELC